MRLILCLLILGGIFYGWTHHAFTSQSSLAQPMPVAELAKLFQPQPGQKVVVLFATWCPACMAEMPSLTASDYPAGTLKYIISVDSDMRRLDTFIKSVNDPSIRWISIGRECSDRYCTNMIGALNAAGIHFKGYLPSITIFDGSASRPYAQDPPAQFISCIMRGDCIFTSTAAGGHITRLR